MELEESIYILDIDSIVDGSARKLLEQGDIRGKIIIHNVVIEFLYKEAKRGRSAGIAGLQELASIMETPLEGVELTVVEEDSKIRVETYDDVKSVIRRYAWKTGGYIITSDPIQAKASRAMGVKVVFTGKPGKDRLKIEEYFDSKTMSVHLKEGTPPLAKVGKPGKWMFVRLSDKPLSRSEIEEIAREIIEASMESGYIEVDRAGSTIIQLKEYRIVITRPPLSDGWEVTAVRPIAKLKLEDYNMPEKLYRRLLEKAEGILIAGAPGMGKTTFAQALAEFYMSQGRVVKTIESPRDMNLPPSITQYSKNYADLGELHDILLLSRPDYTVFDELRTDEDFKLYIDLRLAGIGMIGVIHATTPIDAIQRFINRVELGIIPSIIDTVIFIEEGEIRKVYDLEMTVKLPTGLKEAELSRPVVEVRDFLSGELEYEIYTFGEQTMIVPVKRVAAKGGIEMIERAVKKLLPDAEVEFRDGVVIIKVPRYSPRITAKRIKKVKKIADKLGLDVRFMPV